MVQITSSEVNNYANQLRSLKLEMVQVFHEIQSHMESLPSVWNSPASQNFLSQFQSLYPIFESFNDGLEIYATFLAQTAQSYQENEQALTSAIG